MIPFSGPSFLDKRSAEILTERNAGNTESFDSFAAKFIDQYPNSIRNGDQQDLHYDQARCRSSRPHRGNYPND